VTHGRALVATLALASALTACAADQRTAGTLPPTTVSADAGTTTVSLPTSDCAATPSEPDQRRYATIEGVDERLLSLDVYPLPDECGARPALVWVHAGAWTSGDKRTRIEPIAAMAAANGWVLVSVNYRLSGEGDGEGTGVQWPAQGEDVAAAVGDVVAKAAELRIDPDRIAIMGIAEGGHLATMVAVDPTLHGARRSRSDIGCLVALDVHSFDLVRATGADDDPGIATVFGDDFATLQSASPNAVLGQLANDPEASETAGDLADMLVVSRGSVRNQAIDDDFAVLARAAGADVTALDATAYTAADLEAAIGDAADPLVYPAVVNFLHDCLGRAE
jgi:acetyl esterase/lipase